MKYAIRGTEDPGTYAMKYVSNKITRYGLFKERLESAPTWKTKAGAENIVKSYELKNVEVVEFSDSEYQKAIQEEKFNALRDAILKGGQKHSNYSDTDRQIAIKLLDLQPGTPVRVYPHSDSLRYGIQIVEKINLATFVVGERKYSRLTGQGQEGGYALPNDLISNLRMSERILIDFKFRLGRGEDCGLSPDDKYAIAQIVEGARNRKNQQQKD